MANDSKKVSQLSIATSLSANDRLVVLTSPTTSAQTKTITANNLARAFANSIFPTANSTQLGVVKIGSGINVDQAGIISTATVAATYIITTVVEPSYTVTSQDTVLFVSPGDINSDVTIILPINDAIDGREIIVKNTDNVFSGRNLRITTQEGIDNDEALLEDPVTGDFVIYYDIPTAGEGITFIHDGSVWRHVSSVRSNPVFYSQTDTYHQVAIQNKLEGVNATSDLALYNNLGDYKEGTGPFIDIGIASSSYSNSLYTLYGFNDGYLYVDRTDHPGGNLVIGTAQDSSIIFHANGLNVENRIMSINSISIEATIKKDNDYTKFYQNKTYWGGYSENDDSDTHGAWAWIETGLPNTINPYVFIENQRGDTGANYRWTFDANGGLQIPAKGSIGSEGGFYVENAITVTANNVVVHNNVYDDLYRPLLNPNALDINADGGTSTSVFAIRDEVFTGGGSTTVFGRYEAALDGGVSFNNRHSASYIDGGGANVL
jgi:hypothetical protein